MDKEIVINFIVDASKERTFYRAKSEFEKQYIIQALKMMDGHLTKTATHMGINRMTLTKKIHNYDIDAKSFRKPKEKRKRIYKPKKEVVRTWDKQYVRDV